MAAMTFEDILKFNPYHDALGRFTTPNGGSAGSFKSISVKEATKMKISMGQDLDPYFDDDAKILKNQQSGYFGTRNSFDINRKIRSGEELTAEEQKTVDTIDRLMAPLSEGVKVTRMATASFMETIAKKEYSDLETCSPKDEGKCFEALKSAIVGGTVTESAYMSTSYDASKNNFMKSRGVQIEINVPKGTKALFSPTDDEAEILLAKNTSYRIDNIINRGYGDITMEVTVIAA